MKLFIRLVPVLLASFLFVCARASEPTGVIAKAAPKAKPDSLKFNNFSIDLNFLTHGEICAGGLPRDDVKDEEQIGKGGTSAFLLGRVRLIVGYQRKWLEAKLAIQNLAIWGMNSNMAVMLYEGWVRAKAPF